MLSLIKLIIWIAGALVVAYFVMNFFGYEVNKEYFSASKERCRQKIRECSDNVFHKGIDNAECDFNCADPKLIIKKKTN